MSFIRMRQRIFVLILTGLLLLPFSALNTSAQTEEYCFPETGYCISGRIRQFWENQGGLTVFGYPITPQREEIIQGAPYQVQWFERNRLELHPENPPPYDVLLGRLGADDQVMTRSDGVDQSDREQPQDDCLYFDTGWNVCGAFLQHFRSYGVEKDGQDGFSVEENIALFGKPLSPRMTYTSQGVEYPVQWFERARFELHSHQQTPHHVQLGLLGSETLARANTPSQTPSHTDGEQSVIQNDPCAGVPDPVHATILPGKCVTQGEQLSIDIFGFEADEHVGFWITAPDDSVVGTTATLSIGEHGEVNGIPIDTSELPPGLWSLVFEGTSSGHRAIVYFQIIGE
jgi:hypothetical protein